MLRFMLNYTAKSPELREYLQWSFKSYWLQLIQCWGLCCVQDQHNISFWIQGLEVLRTKPSVSSKCYSKIYRSTATVHLNPAQNTYYLLCLSAGLKVILMPCPSILLAHLAYNQLHTLTYRSKPQKPQWTPLFWSSLTQECNLISVTVIPSQSGTGFFHLWPPANINPGHFLNVRDITVNDWEHNFPEFVLHDQEGVISSLNSREHHCHIQDFYGHIIQSII